MPVFFEYDDDVSAIWNMAKYATSATALAHRTPIVMLQNMVDLVRGQAVFLDMRDVASWRWIPDNLHPSHGIDTLEAYCILLQHSSTSPGSVHMSTVFESRPAVPRTGL
ncbi:MAG: hypothetical protein ACKOK8_09075 [Planctomycetia bacterium]